MKKLSLLTAISFCAIFGLTGCKEKGDDFIGNWERVDKKIPTKEDTMVISLEDGVFHIYRKSWESFKGPRGGYVDDKFKARAESENVLAVIGGFTYKVGSTIVIQDGNLSTADGATYKKISE